MSDTNRMIFGTKLQNHDWYYAYSDDHRYWTAGRNQRQELNALHKSLECPYDFADLSKWAHNMILEQFAEEGPDAWYRQPRQYQSVAPCKRSELLTENEWNDIQSWFEKP